MDKRLHLQEMNTVHNKSWERGLDEQKKEHIDISILAKDPKMTFGAQVILLSII